MSASYTLRPSPLVVSELMFHPAPPPAGSPFKAGDFEFLELQNLSDRAVDLAGCRFTHGSRHFPKLEVTPPLELI